MINHMYSDVTALCGNTLKRKTYPQSAYWPTPVNHYREFPKRTTLLIVLEGFLVTVELHIRLSLLVCKYGCYNKAQLQGKSFCLACSRNYTPS